jgi:hypothetical protein
VPAKQSLAQELTRDLRNFGRAALGSWRVQPAEPHDSPVAERDIEALIDAHGLNASARPPASRKAGTRENDGQERRVSAAEPPPGAMA